MGSFSNHTLSLANYQRTNNPNFSVSIRTNKYNKSLVDGFLDISDDCFGPGSIFDKIVEYSSKNRADLAKDVRSRVDALLKKSDN